MIRRGNVCLKNVELGIFLQMLMLETLTATLQNTRFHPVTTSFTTLHIAWVEKG